MIQKESKLYTLDNTAIRKTKCIQILYKQKTKIGAILVVSIKKKKHNLKIKYKVYKSLLLTTKKVFKRKNGFYIKSDLNSNLILNNNLKLIGNRIKAPLFLFELGNKKLKIEGLVKLLKQNRKLLI